MSSNGERKDNTMGKWGATSYIIGNIVGSGIFITPSSVLRNSSSMGMALLIWALSGVIATLGAFCYLELGTSIRRSGGDFAYLCYVKWKPIAFAFMIMGCLFTYPATIAVQCETFGEYVIQGLGIEFCSPLRLYYARKLIGFTLLVFILFINFFSVQKVVARFAVAAMIAKVTATGAIIAVGAYALFFKGQTEYLKAPFANTTFNSAMIVNAFFAGLFSYDGWDILNFGNEDISDPRKSMSFALIVGMAIVAFLYLTINVSFFTVLSPAEILSTNAVAKTFAQHSFGKFQQLMPVLVCVVLIGAINATLFMASRYTYAASRERHLPSFIACINSKHDSPRAALFVTVILIMAFSFLGDLERLISYVGFSHWLQRAVTMFALFYIRFREIPVHAEAIRLPIIIPIIFACICIILVTTTIVNDFLTSFVALFMVAIGVVVFTLFVWQGTNRNLKQFSWYRRLTYSINDLFCFISQIVFDGEIKLAEKEKKMDSNHKVTISPQKYKRGATHLRNGISPSK